MVFTGWRKWLNRLSPASRSSKRRPAYKRGHRPLDLESLETRVVPAVKTWTGAGTDNLWRDAANWNLNIAPSLGDDLVFPKNALQLVNTNDFVPGANFNSITFNGGG